MCRNEVPGTMKSNFFSDYISRKKYTLYTVCVNNLHRKSTLRHLGNLFDLLVNSSFATGFTFYRKKWYKRSYLNVKQVAYRCDDSGRIYSYSLNFSTTIPFPFIKMHNLLPLFERNGANVGNTLIIKMDFKFNGDVVCFNFLSLAANLEEKIKRRKWDIAVEIKNTRI